MSDKHKYFEPGMHKQALQAECCRLHDQRDQLREALDNLVRVVEGEGGTRPNAIDEARAALKATEEG